MQDYNYPLHLWFFCFSKLYQMKYINGIAVMLCCVWQMYVFRKRSFFAYLPYWFFFWLKCYKFLDFSAFLRQRAFFFLKKYLSYLIKFITIILMFTTEIENGVWFASIESRGSRFNHNPSPPPSINVRGSGKSSVIMTRINIALGPRDHFFS